MNRISSFFVKFLLPLLILAVGGFTAHALLNSGQKAGRKQVERNAVLVEIQKIQFGPRETRLDAMGVVRAARETELRPRVSGEVIEISPELVPGGRLMAGSMVARIDPTDYRLALHQKETELAQAQSALQLELGQQAIAVEELKLLESELSREERELVLRKPQLQSAQASLRAAEVAVERARLDLERTEIRAPFNAVVKSFHVNQGAQVTSASTLAVIVGTDAYWVEALVPVNQLAWVLVPQASGEPGAAARVYLKPDPGAAAYREGRVIRLATDLEERGRMARLLIEVRDPLSLKAGNEGKSPLIIGTYTRVEIEGLPLDEAAVVDRDVLRNGNRLYVMNAEDQLEIREVEIAFRDRETVLVTAGIAHGERLVLTDLTAPVPGMPLRVEATGGQGGDHDQGLNMGTGEGSGL